MIGAILMSQRGATTGGWLGMALALSWWTLLSGASLAADAKFAEKFAALKTSAPAEEIQKFLEESYKDEQNNPDYFALASNYWWGLSETLNISTKPAEAGDFVVASQKDGKAVGSISETGKVNPELPKRTLALLEEGAQRFPQRMDIVMGLASVQMDLGKGPECFATLDTFLRSAAHDAGAFKWTNDLAPPDSPQKFIPESVYHYVSKFYKSGKPEDEKRCRALSEDLIAAFPEHVYGYNILAALDYRHQDYAACLGHLKIAHEKAADDTLVLMNLAEAYARMKDKAGAITCYREVEKGSAEAGVKADAKKAIAELEGKAGKKKR